MAILLDGSSKVIVQGITGRTATKHSKLMRDYGTDVVAGVAPGKGGTEHLGVPVYDTVAEAKAVQGGDVAVLFLPPLAAKDGILEAVYSEIPLIVCVVEGVPVHDMIMVFEKMKGSRSRLIGPNSPGIITPGKAKVGFLPERAAAPGHVGVVSRSGTLSYEVCFEMAKQGFGQSTWLGLGGDGLKGTTFADVLPMFQADPATDAIVLIGEIGGSDEEDAAFLCRHQIEKPVICLVAGRTAPRGKRMGHAGAIITGGRGSYDAKVKALRDAGLLVASTPAEVVQILGSLSLRKTGS